MLWPICMQADDVLDTLQATFNTDERVFISDTAPRNGPTTPQERLLCSNHDNPASPEKRHGRRDGRRLLMGVCEVDQLIGKRHLYFSTIMGRELINSICEPEASFEINCTAASSGNT
jgi:hypothetical protein